jgi:hypothetical protein
MFIRNFTTNRKNKRNREKIRKIKKRKKKIKIKIYFKKILLKPNNALKEIF